MQCKEKPLLILIPPLCINRFRNYEITWLKCIVYYKNKHGRSEGGGQKGYFAPGSRLKAGPKSTIEIKESTFKLGGTEKFVPGPQNCLGGPEDKLIIIQMRSSLFLQMYLSVH